MRCGWIGAALLAAGGMAHADQSANLASASEQLTPPASWTPSPITDHVALSAMFFWGHVDTTAQFTSATDVVGVPFSAESDLGLTDKATQPRFELMFRLAQRGRLRLDFLDLRRGAEQVIDRTIQFGDQTYRANQLLQSEIDWRQTDFTYTYSFLRNDRFELGAGLGIHLIQAEASAQVPGTQQRSDYTAAGPFATVALDGTWRISRYWAFSARGQYMKLSTHNGNGLLGEYHADLQYRWRANMAFGAGYEYEEIDVDFSSANPTGTVRMNISGPELFARLAF